jgi:hypothetical protein
MRNQLKALCLTPLSALIVALGVTPANAIPGQNANSFVKWVKSNPQLPAVKYNSESQGYDGRKSNLYFYAGVTSRQGTITREGVTISGDSSIKFSRQNAKAIKTIQGIYGSKIANDFKDSQYITKVGRDSFLRGKLYGYSVAQVQNGTNLEIFLLKNLQKKIDNAKFCQKNQCDV